ncbi:MAG: dTDP-glucose pyrophosphorylase [Parcubacteria group bacterium Gr01-1014_38]|nr:MAG: dTDP-glucose pyrophosphorylase [Parcubacteria group bacterium Gr01-1014_38]
MQAVIPIAGKGKRMTQTYQGPKQLLAVAGQPLVEYALGALPPEVDKLVLVVGGPYEQQIRAYFGSEHQGRTVTYVRQPEPLGLGHAIQQAAPVVEGKFLIVLPDDIYVAEDLQAMVRHEGLAMLAKRTEHPEHFAVLVCDAEGCLVRAVEKPKEPVSDLVSIGPYLLDQEFFELQVPPSSRGEIELPDLVMALVRERGRRVKVLEASFWLAVNDPAQLTNADREMLKHLKVSVST